MITQFTSEQRKALADMLKINSTMRDKALSARRETRDELETALVHDLAEKNGVTKLAADIVEAQQELARMQLELRSAGFDVAENGEIDLRWEAKSHRTAIDKKVAKELGTDNDVHKQFDSAMVSVWTAETVEDAKKIVESLLK